MKNIIRIFILLLVTGKLTAQTCIVADTCPVAPVQFCDITNNNAELWNETYWLDPVTGLHDLPDAAVDLAFTATDTCANGSITIKFILFLDLDGNGTQETAVGSDSLPGFNTVKYGNVSGAGALRAFDERPVPADQKYGFALETVVNGPATTARVRWNTEAQPGTYIHPELPYGQHKIKWFIADAQGQESICEYNFVVKDCKAPTVVCLNGLSVNIMPNGQITLWAWDFLQYAEDNHTPSNLLQFGIRKAGAGTGFPMDSLGIPSTSVVFNCDEIGDNPIELWSRDQSGNADFCQTIVTVQDINNQCGDTGPLISCATTWCTGTAIGGVTFYAYLNAPGLPPIALTDSMPDANGCVTFPEWAFPASSDYLLYPAKNDDPLNGVNTLDLIRITKHILGLQPLPSPYAMIAADANKSNSITTFDLVEHKKLIQGIYDELPNNTSWRFVDANFVFPNPANPFQTSIPETNSGNVQNITLYLDFIGIKTGDVDCSAAPGFNAPADDRAACVLTLPDAVLLPGESAEIPVRMAQPGEWLGLQTSWQFDPKVLEIEGVVPGNLPGMDETAFFRPQPGMLNAVWFDAVPQAVSTAENLFVLKLKALAPVRLSEALSLATKKLSPEAYTADEAIQKLQLQFNERSDPAGTTAIFPPQPNPTTAGVTIPLRLGQTETVTLELSDLTGKRRWLHQITLPAGTHLYEIPASAMPRAGMYVWRIKAGTTMESGKLVRM